MCILWYAWCVLHVWMMCMLCLARVIVACGSCDQAMVMPQSTSFFDLMMRDHLRSFPYCTIVAIATRFEFH